MSKIVKLSQIRKLLEKFQTPEAAFKAVLSKNPSAKINFDKFYMQKPIAQRQLHEIESQLASMLGYAGTEDDCRTCAEQDFIWEDVTKVVEL